MQGNLPARRGRFRIRGANAADPVGMQLRVDAAGDRARFVPPTGPDGEASRAAGYAKEVRQGRDRCHRFTRLV